MPAGAIAAGGSQTLMHANNDLTNTASLRRGARNYVNYCQGCHSASFVRYNQLAKDLQLSESQMLENLMFTGDRIFDTMTIAMPADEASAWFGRTPPDLSLTGRSRGADWLYTYLMTFYVDEKSPVGSNNLALPGASMPHVLWELQGLQRAVFRDELDDGGNVHKVFEDFEPVTQGSLTPREYEQFVRDIVNFLAYIGEPVQLKRRAMGGWVLAFLLVFFVLALLLKKEYWSDVR
ncbi:MAG: cytochrome c1 [Gammaproteobacteria bacterium]|nr:cytochrome c1 [Gammaproteobacteria bacterium]